MAKTAHPGPERRGGQPPPHQTPLPHPTRPGPAGRTWASRATRSNQEEAVCPPEESTRSQLSRKPQFLSDYKEQGYLSTLCCPGPGSKKSQGRPTLTGSLAGSQPRPAPGPRAWTCAASLPPPQRGTVTASAVSCSAPASCSGDWVPGHLAQVLELPGTPPGPPRPPCPGDACPCPSSFHRCCHRCQEASGPAIR